MSRTSSDRPELARGRTALCVVLMIAHLALCVALVAGGVGSVYILDESVGAVQFLTPFVVGAVLGIAELVLLGFETAAHVWLLSLAASFVVAATGFALGELHDVLFLVALCMPTVVGAGLTALFIMAVDRAHHRYL